MVAEAVGKEDSALHNSQNINEKLLGLDIIGKNMAPLDTFPIQRHLPKLDHELGIQFSI